GVDWCVELHNLYTKDEHGGGSSNNTVDRIIKESPLVQIYRNIRVAVDKNFALTHLTTAHSDPDMTKTFNELQKHLTTVNSYKITPGRKSKYIIDDMIDRGRTLLKVNDIGEGIGNSDEVEESAEAEDILVELVL
ncbi:hypothetical protein B0H34DRAFT_821015, partial [Crassisporium funariophilum]